MTASSIERPNNADVQRVEGSPRDRLYRPDVDIVERRDEWTVLVDMPGVCADAVDIQFEKGTLSIDGKVQPRHPRDVGYLVKEYGVGDFHRTLAVGDAIDSSRIRADFSEGVLTLHLPKTEAVKPRRISVEAN